MFQSGDKSLPRHDNQAVGSGSQIEKPMVVVQHPARPRGSRRLRTVVLVEVCSPAHRRPQHGGHIRPLEDPRAVARVPGRSCRHRAAPWTLARTGRSKWSSRTILKSYRLGFRIHHVAPRSGDYLRHSNLNVTNKYLQATSKTKRSAQGKLVDAILPGGVLSTSKSNPI